MKGIRTVCAECIVLCVLSLNEATIVRTPMGGLGNVSSSIILVLLPTVY